MSFLLLLTKINKNTTINEKHNFNGIMIDKTIQTNKRKIYENIIYK